MAQNGFILLKCAIFIKSKVSTLLCHFERIYLSFITRKVALNAHFLYFMKFSQNKEIEDFYEIQRISIKWRHASSFWIKERNAWNRRFHQESKILGISWIFISFIRNQPKVLISRDKEIFDFVKLIYRHLLGAHEIIKISWNCLISTGHRP